MARLTRRAAILGAAGGSAALLAGRAARAQGFHGFDPATFDGSMLSSDALHAMAADAAAASKPHNGKQVVIGFANLARDVAFCLKVEGGIKQNAAAAGVELVVADNHLDGATALANAESFLRRQVDYVIEFQTDAAFGATIMAKMNDADTKVVAIDIPMPGATFFGVNNPRAGFMAGSYLAQAAGAKFGADRMKNGYLVVGELPQSGAIPAMRTGGEEAGFRRSLPGFDPAHVIKFDSKNTLQESFSQMSNVIGRIPAGAAIMLTGINDQVALGMLRAAKQAGRGTDAIAVGMGADETEALAHEDGFVASVGSFPERYGNYLIPIALMQLAGKPVPPAVLVHHVMVTKGNICKYYPKQSCATGQEIAFAFPEAAFKTYLTELRASPALKDFTNLIPTD